jgi:hypothetical protein
MAFDFSPVFEYEYEISCRFSRFIKLALYPALMIRKVDRHYSLIGLLYLKFFRKLSPELAVTQSLIAD